MFGYEDAFKEDDENWVYTYSVKCQSTVGYVLFFTWHDTFGKLSQNSNTMEFIKNLISNW